VACLIDNLVYQSLARQEPSVQITNQSAEWKAGRRRSRLLCCAENQTACSLEGSASEVPLVLL